MKTSFVLFVCLVGVSLAAAAYEEVDPKNDYIKSSVDKVIGDYNKRTRGQPLEVVDVKKIKHDKEIFVKPTYVIKFAAKDTEEGDTYQCKINIFYLKLNKTLGKDEPQYSTFNCQPTEPGMSAESEEESEEQNLKVRENEEDSVETTDEESEEDSESANDEESDEYSESATDEESDEYSESATDEESDEDSESGTDEESDEDSESGTDEESESEEEEEQLKQRLGVTAYRKMGQDDQSEDIDTNDEAISNYLKKAVANYNRRQSDQPIEIEKVLRVKHDKESIPKAGYEVEFTAKGGWNKTPFDCGLNIFFLQPEGAVARQENLRQHIAFKCIASRNVEIPSGDKDTEE